MFVVMTRPNKLVRSAVEEGIVFAAAQLPADALIKSQQLTVAKARGQEVLSVMGCGITLTSVTLRNPTFPVSVERAVREVLNAESEKARLIEEAQEHRDRVLGETAGQAYAWLVAMIGRYELAATSGADADGTMRAIAEQLDEAFDRLETTDGHGTPLAIGGAVAEVIFDARSYRTEVVASTQGDAEYFLNLLPEYRANPRIVLSRLWQDAKQEILSGDIETVYLPKGRTYLDLNRDPKVRQQRERRRFSQPQHSDDEHGS